MRWLDLYRHLRTDAFARGVAGELLDKASRYIRSVCAAVVNDAASAGQF